MFFFSYPLSLASSGTIAYSSKALYNRVDFLSHLFLLLLEMSIEIAFQIQK